MTLSDCKLNSSGRVVALVGAEATRRRLADIGLIGAAYLVRAVNKHSVLVDFDGISAVVERALAANIKVRQSEHEDSVMRKPERR